MRVIRDEKNDTVFVRLAEGEIVESKEVKPGLMVDYDGQGRSVAIEFLNASQHIGEPSDLTNLRVA